MMGIKRLLVLFSVLGLATLACGMTVDLGIHSAPTPTQQSTVQNQVATMVAGTVQAFTQMALSATPAATLTPTNTPLPPTLSVSVATNCYAGPRTDYGFVITIYPGTTVTVVGKDTADNSWIIDVPGYPGTVCWLSGQNAKITGNTVGLPAPATPVISIYTLSEPRNLRVSCTSESLSGTPEPWWHNASEWTVVFRWTNTDADQTGVRVYRNGWHLATLGGRASSFTESFFHQGRHGVTYAVQAVTSARVSSIVSIDLDHCR
ncbi:MAG: hypothetical protein ACXWNQ_07705 [Anaerolineales bacterium]